MTYTNACTGCNSRSFLAITSSPAFASLPVLPGAPVAPASPGKLGVALPVGAVANEKCHKQPPQTLGGRYANTSDYLDRLFGVMSNIICIVIDGHDTTTLIDTGDNCCTISKKFSGRL